MPYYCIRKEGQRLTLEEMASFPYWQAVALNPARTPNLAAVTPQQARQWVKAGMPHTTGLYVNAAGAVRYARSEPGPTLWELRNP